MYIYVYVRICVFICIHIYVCMYIYVYTCVGFSRAVIRQIRAYYVLIYI